MFANRFTAVLDANVLVSPAKRDLILTLAQAEMYRFRWTHRILEETEKALASIFKSQNREEPYRTAANICNLLKSKFPEAMIPGNFSDVKIYEGLPDDGDHHVVHAAIICKASLIVTDNLKDFPADVLKDFEVEAKSADDFIADAIELDTTRTVRYVKMLRARLKAPSITGKELLEIWDKRHGLTATVKILRPFQGAI